MSDNLQLEKCLQLIVDKMRWGPSSTWKHRQFVELSSLIQERSGVLISLSSLKRLFGKVSYNHQPQYETRNALVIFLGYESWDDFTAKNSISFTEPIKEKTISVFTSTWKIFVLGIVAVFLIIPLFYLIKKKKENTLISKVRFSGTYIKSNYPSAVVFNYNIQDLSDSIVINYDDDFTDTPREVLDPKKHTITHRYILPDLYQVSLIHKGRTIRTLSVNLETQSWQAFLAYNNMTKFYYIETQKETGRLEVNPEEVYKTGLFRKDEAVVVKYRLVNDLGINGDQCRLKFRVADLNKIKSLDCFFASFVIHGDSGKINITFAQKDCLNKAYIKFGEQIFDGKVSDLSALSTDFSTWQDIELKVKDNKLSIFINNQSRLNLQFPIRMGKIKVILFDTPLSGAMDCIELSDINTGKCYYNAF